MIKNFIVTLFILLFTNNILAESHNLNQNNEASTIISLYFIFFVKILFFFLCTFLLYLFNNFMELSSQKSDTEIKSTLLLSTTILTLIFCFMFL